MKLSILWIAILVFSPIILLAQGNDGKMEITIHSGFSFLDADERVETPPCIICRDAPPFPFVFVNEKSMNGSFLFGVKAGYYLNQKMEVEGAFAIAPNHEVTEINDIFCPPGELCPLIDEIPLLIPSFLNQTNAVSYQYDANFVYNFTETNVKPFVTFGIGAVTTDLLLENQTDFALNFGGGAKFYFKNLGLRVEVNDHVMPDYFLTGKTEHDVQVQYGFLFRLP